MGFAVCRVQCGGGPLGRRAAWNGGAVKPLAPRLHRA
jgi:hypothetical protein